MNDQRISELENNRIDPDNDAYYAKTLTLDLGTVSPHISGPDHVKTMTAVSAVREEKQKINSDSPCHVPVLKQQPQGKRRHEQDGAKTKSARVYVELLGKGACQPPGCKERENEDDE